MSLRATTRPRPGNHSDPINHDNRIASAPDSHRVRPFHLHLIRRDGRGGLFFARDTLTDRRRFVNCPTAKARGLQLRG
jgi:hypothetical protein